jgi:hypothetical protein
MIEIVLSVIAGFLGHQLEGPTRDWFPGDDENRIISYVEGMGIIHLVFAAITVRKLEWKTWWLVNGLLSIVSITVGIGTVLGYVFDGLKRNA